MALHCGCSRRLRSTNNRMRSAPCADLIVIMSNQLWSLLGDGVHSNEVGTGRGCFLHHHCDGTGPVFFVDRQLSLPLHWPLWGWTDGLQPS